MGLFQHVNSEIERRIQTLIRDGILDRAEGEQLQARLISADQAAREAAFPTDEEIEQLLIRRGVPSQEDLKNLNEKLDELVVKLENVEITRE
jgi:polyhydroxyalkanoate synthesis regulator phasin